MSSTTFIIDCPWCKAKVAADEKGRAERAYFDDEAGQPYANRIYVGSCPICKALLVGESNQIGFENFDADEDYWSDIVRVFPKPGRAFSSLRIPTVVKDSLVEADRSMQANANIAGCVMLGRALEALCRDVLGSSAPTQTPAAGTTPAPPLPAQAGTTTPAQTPKKPKPIMLAEGIRKLKDKGIIDERLYDWSQQLHAFRNLGAHPEDVSISREDAEDLQSFAYAIIEYVYDLTDRYEEFKARVEKRKSARRRRSSRSAVSTTFG